MNLVFRRVIKNVSKFFKLPVGAGFTVDDTTAIKDSFDSYRSGENVSVQIPDRSVNVTHRPLLGRRTYGAASEGGGEEGEAPQDFGVVWTPDAADWQSRTLLSLYDDVPTLDTLVIAHASLATLDVINQSGLTSISCPNVTAIDGSSWPVLNLAFNTALEEVLLPLCEEIPSGITIDTCLALASLALGSVQSIGTGDGTGISITTCGITALDLHSLTALGNNEIIVNSCTQLQTINLAAFLPPNNSEIDLSVCGLLAASVNHVLARCVASAAFVSGLVDMHGGTNAAPTGQGITNKATLIARGVTVSTN